MKSLQLSALLILGALAVFSCKKDDEDHQIQPPMSGSMSARIGFEEWTASEEVVGSYNNQVLNIKGSSISKQLQLELHNIKRTGTYSLGDTASASSGKWSTGSGPMATYSTEFGGSGIVEVLDISNSSAEGSFHFTAPNDSGDVVEVSHGKFAVDF